MPLSPSAHVDTFCRDNLPPGDEWPELVFDLPELHYPERLNAAVELLDAAVDRWAPTALASWLRTPGRWTYGDLKRLSNQVAAVLVDDLGVVPGNRVLLRGPNNPWLVACWFGVLKAGAVAVATDATAPRWRAGCHRGDRRHRSCPLRQPLHLETSRRPPCPGCASSTTAPRGD